MTLGGPAGGQLSRAHLRYARFWQTPSPFVVIRATQPLFSRRGWGCCHRCGHEQCACQPDGYAAQHEQGCCLLPAVQPPLAAACLKAPQDALLILPLRRLPAAL